MIKNLYSLGLLRNGKVYATKQLAIQGLRQSATNDGVAKLARYLAPTVGGDPIIRTVVGFYANAAEMEDNGGGQSYYTVLDIEGNASDLDDIRTAIAEINSKIGDGIEGTTLTIVIEDINTRLGGGFTAENTVAKSLVDLRNAMTVTVVKEAESGDYAAVYTIKQGGVLLNTINIPKDQFVKYAAVVKGTWDGDTFTPDPEGTDEAIEIVFQEVKDPIYINIKDLVNMYVGDKGIEIIGDKVSVKLDSTCEAFLTVSENGLKLDGVQKAIDDAIVAATLHESDGIKILGNNKIKAHAATMIGDGINNPIYVDEEGIKLSKDLDMGYYDYITAVNYIPSPSDAASANLVLTTQAAIESLTASTEYNSITVAKGDFNTSDLKLNAKSGVAIDNVTVNGGKGASNAKMIINADKVAITNTSIASGSTAYNIFEGNQSTANTQYFTKEYTVSNFNCDNTQLNHNVFNIYTPSDNAVITIKDSYFNIDGTKTNILRMSNVSNATNVTINFENITWTCENGNTADTAWNGLLLYQAYGADAAASNDTSKIRTWKINVKDCVYNGVKVTSNNFGKINQVAYLYGIGGSNVPVDPTNVMTMKFE